MSAGTPLLSNFVSASLYPAPKASTEDTATSVVIPAARANFVLKPTANFPTSIPAAIGPPS